MRVAEGPGHVISRDDIIRNLLERRPGRLVAPEIWLPTSRHRPRIASTAVYSQRAQTPCVSDVRDLAVRRCGVQRAGGARDDRQCVPRGQELARELEFHVNRRPRQISRCFPILRQSRLDPRVRITALVSADVHTSWVFQILAWRSMRRAEKQQMHTHSFLWPAALAVCHHSQRHPRLSPRTLVVRDPGRVRIP